MTTNIESIPKRRRGRPKSSDDQIASKRAPILNAAAQLLSEMHSNAITVDQLIELAKISRPTFYRWFPNGVEQVIEYLISEAHLELMRRLQSVLAQHEQIEDKIREGISTYFQWCVDLGPVIYGIYREGFDEKSSAYRYRMQGRQFTITLFQYYVDAINIENIHPMSIETMVSWIESAAITLCAHAPIQSGQAQMQTKLTTAMFIGTVDSISPTWRQRVLQYEAQFAQANCSK